MMKWKENKVNVTRSWNFFAGDYYTCNVITQISPHTALEVNAPGRGEREQDEQTKAEESKKKVSSSSLAFCCCSWSLRVRRYARFLHVSRGKQSLCTSRKEPATTKPKRIFSPKERRRHMRRKREEKMREKRIKCAFKLENRK